VFITVCGAEKEFLFKNRTFVIIGFEADEEAHKFMSELVTDNGGGTYVLMFDNFQSNYICVKEKM